MGLAIADGVLDSG